MEYNYQHDFSIIRQKKKISYSYTYNIKMNSMMYYTIYIPSYNFE